VAYVLIVEDDPDTVTILTKVIQLKFPDWTIDSAGSVPEARRRLAEARKPYDFAILDFKLPDENAVIRGDLSLCIQIRHRTPATRVFHITAYREDPELDCHVEGAGDADGDHAISKDKTGWMERVVVKLQSFLHGDRIEAKLKSLFLSALFENIQGSRHEIPRSVQGRQRNQPSDRSLCRHAIHWNLLTPSVQKLVKSYLSVDDSRFGDVRVSLIGEVKSE